MKTKPQKKPPGRVTVDFIVSEVLDRGLITTLKRHPFLSRFIARKAADELERLGRHDLAEELDAATRPRRENTGLKPGATKHPRVQLKGTSKARVVVPVGVIGAKNDDDVKITANRARTKITVERRTQA